jgi:hypothetical protein
MIRVARSLTAALLPLDAVISCGDAGSARARVANASARVALAAASLSGQEATLANEVTRPTYMGFDTGAYPGDDAMRAWRTGNSPYTWTGYYLPSPCHQDEGWSGKRETLTSIGWGSRCCTWVNRRGAASQARRTSSA